MWNEIGMLFSPSPSLAGKCMFSMLFFHFSVMNGQLLLCTYKISPQILRFLKPSSCLPSSVSSFSVSSFSASLFLPGTAGCLEERTAQEHKNVPCSANNKSLKRQGEMLRVQQVGGCLKAAQESPRSHRTNSCSSVFDSEPLSYPGVLQQPK